MCLVLVYRLALLEATKERAIKKALKLSYLRTEMIFVFKINTPVCAICVKLGL